MMDAEVEERVAAPVRLAAPVIVGEGNAWVKTVRTRRTRPRRPDATIRRASRASRWARRLKPIVATACRRAPSSTRASASLIESAIGFSRNRCFPARRTSSPIRACSRGGTHAATASTSDPISEEASA